MAKLIIIAALGKNSEIGKNNQLIWHLKEDLQFFKAKTTNHKIVMGYNTFKSLPKLLPNRDHLVLTTHKLNIEGIKVFASFAELINYLNTLDEEVYIIGGSSIYRLFLPVADELLLTEINAEDKEADAYFPDFNISDYEKTILKEVTEQDITYHHVLLRRIKKCQEN